MDKFLVKIPGDCTAGKSRGGNPEETGQDKDDQSEEEHRNKKLKSNTHIEGATFLKEKPEKNYTWKKISAEGLDCDYTLLFDKTEADKIFRDLEKEIIYFSGDSTKVQVYGKWYSIPRKQVTYGDPGLTYTYSGVTLSPKPWIPVLDHIRDCIMQATGHRFNFVLINRYKDGNDHIGEHRDDEKELVPRSAIASVSFGACRDFFFRHGASRGKKPLQRIESVKLELAHGSLLLMNYPTNVHWYHSLPVRKKVLLPRINLTFRKVMNLK
ncbi:DNA oxidative demethylase ALKBH2 [Microcaecilia unicolor]|uniref:DNA oxidative demethylase ALKBH2 n=1 Tax=Microcaecilia unicolor TaxID=1415580 RepID=A0A6P7ZFA2_9AMPH|nr:DNA oxidative demethylase ALKBH2 [Microcaecilia unicolor]XP_030075106.1 DNA oxidative demethylase ALKBH2 [Microcaecilia unicolor]